MEAKPRLEVSCAILYLSSLKKQTPGQPPVMAHVPDEMRSDDFCLAFAEKEQNLFANNGTDIFDPIPATRHGAYSLVA
jgi:hypothetical protein